MGLTGENVIQGTHGKGRGTWAKRIAPFPLDRIGVRVLRGNGGKEKKPTYADHDLHRRG